MAFSLLSFCLLNDETFEIGEAHQLWVLPNFGLPKLVVQNIQAIYIAIGITHTIELFLQSEHIVHEALDILGYSQALIAIELHEQVVT